MGHHTWMFLFKIINLLSDWPQILPAQYVFCLFLWAALLCALTSPLHLVQLLPVSVVRSFYCVIYSATSHPDGLRISGEKKKCVLFSASLSFCRRQQQIFQKYLALRFLQSEKVVVGKAPEERLYSCFHGMINANSENFLSWIIKELIERKTVNKVWCNSSWY